MVIIYHINACAHHLSHFHMNRYKYPALMAIFIHSAELYLYQRAHIGSKNRMVIIQHFKTCALYLLSLRLNHYNYLGLIAIFTYPTKLYLRQ